MFQRIPNSFDEFGNPRVKMTSNPQFFTVSSPQLHYILSLCQPKLQAKDAATWINKLIELYTAHEDEMKDLWPYELDLLCELAAVVLFIEKVASVTALPTFSRKNGQAFVSKFQRLESELGEAKDSLNFSDIVGISQELHTLEVAQKALKKFEEWGSEELSADILSLYQRMLNQAQEAFKDQLERLKAKQTQSSKFEWPTLRTEPEPDRIRVAPRKEKQKTRPPNSDADEEPVAEEAVLEPPVLVSKFENISPTTSESMSRLFCKTETRGPLASTAFEAAMAGLGFSITPMYGSVYKFSPPESMGVSHSFTTHRPHGSKIEGFPGLILAHRLRNIYGWQEDTFKLD